MIEGPKAAESNRDEEKPQETQSPKMQQPNKSPVDAMTGTRVTNNALIFGKCLSYISYQLFITYTYRFLTHTFLYLFLKVLKVFIAFLFLISRLIPNINLLKLN